MSTLEERLAEEIERVGGIMPVAAKLGVDRNTIRNWINNGTVTSKRLQEMAAEEIGVDLQYILLGLRSPKEPVQPGMVLHTKERLTPDEATLLDNYRHCPPEGQAAIKATSAALAKCSCDKPVKRRA